MGGGDENEVGMGQSALGHKNGTLKRAHTQLTTRLPLLAPHRLAHTQQAGNAHPRSNYPGTTHHGAIIPHSGARTSSTLAPSGAPTQNGQATPGAHMAEATHADARMSLQTGRTLKLTVKIDCLTPADGRSC